MLPYRMKEQKEERERRMGRKGREGGREGEGRRRGKKDVFSLTTQAQAPAGGQVAQWLAAFAALRRNPSSVPSTLI